MPPPKQASLIRHTATLEGEGEATAVEVGLAQNGEGEVMAASMTGEVRAAVGDGERGVMGTLEGKGEVIAAAVGSATAKLSPL
jgi:hypothetical protein